jgi:hypothetical protein
MNHWKTMNFSNSSIFEHSNETFLKFAQSSEWDEKEPFRRNEIFQISVDL